MSEVYEYSPEVFRELADVLELMYAETQQLPRSVKCFPCVNDFPHVLMEYTDAFIHWAIPKFTRIAPCDGEVGCVKLMVDIGHIRIYAIIPEDQAEQWKISDKTIEKCGEPKRCEQR